MTLWLPKKIKKQNYVAKNPKNQILPDDPDPFSMTEQQTS